MDGYQASSNSPPPFLTKTYDMVDDPVTNSFVSWSQSGCSFIVWNQPEFTKDLLPKYFKHCNFSSFVRQLNTYGFRKIDPDQWEFANEDFIRGQRHLLTNIQRRKPVHSHSLQNQGSSTVPTSETERREFEEEIIRLNHDKSLLLLELQRHEGENHELKFQIQSVGLRLQNMEYRQMQLMAFLAQLVQKPSFASILMQQSEIHNKKRRLLEPNYSYNNSNPDRNMELLEKLEVSLNYWEKSLFDIGEATDEKMYDSGTSFRHYPVMITEMDASSEDLDMIAHKSCSPSLHPSSPHSRYICSSAEVAMSMDHVDTPAISSVHLNILMRPESSGINVNLNPGSNFTEVDALKEVGAGRTRGLPSGVNDVFWEQFLTEAPNSSDTHESMSERTNTNGGTYDSKPGEEKRFWWNANKVNNLTEQMGHLSS